MQYLLLIYRNEAEQAKMAHGEAVGGSPVEQTMGKEVRPQQANDAPALVSTDPQSYIEKVALSQSVRECAQVGNEAEADMYGINASREPYGWATSAMRLAAYRKLDPGPIEEFVFYDHPSGRNRVRRAMLWLKENPTAVATMPAIAPSEAAPPPM